MNINLPKVKAAFAKSGIVYETDGEYFEAMENLVGFFDLVIQMDQEQKNKSKNT